MIDDKQKQKNIFRITGGLGNQMCQYAFMYQRSRKKGVDMKLDITSYKIARLMGYVNHHGYELDRIFGIKERASIGEIIKVGGLQYYLQVLARKLGLIPKVVGGSKVCVENNPRDSHKYISSYQSNNCRYFQGFFEHYKYYYEYKDELGKIFTFPNYQDERNIQLSQEIEVSNSVGIHLRRNDKGEFFHNGDAGGLDYYKHAIEWIRRHTDNPTLYIFSNDPDWCKKILEIKDAHYISHNQGDDAFRDMQLLSECKHLIVANSTFSFWAGLLKMQKAGYIICPKIWNKTRDGHPAPKEWVRI
ncbi:MAG: alpha-1,2-fucosyltransferase [Patescibacteria group bacterium]